MPRPRICPLLSALAAASSAFAQGGEPRIIDVPGSQTVVMVWSEAGENGTAAHFYAIDLDGGGWDRVQRTSYTLRLRYGEFAPTEEAVPEVPEFLSADLESEQVYIVQFETQPLEGYRQAIGQLGGCVHQYLAQHAHLVRMTPAVRDQVAALPFVRWVGPYQPAYRLEGFLVDNLEIADDAYPLQRYNVMVFEAGAAQKSAVADRILAIGGIVPRADAGKFLLEATLTPEQLFQVASWNEVLFVDRWSEVEHDIDVARELSGANYLESMEGFSGDGVRGEVLDGGFNVEHADFLTRPLIQHTPVGESFHGAATSGIIFGDGTANPIARGILPNGHGIIADVEHVFNGAPRYQHTAELLEPPYRAVFQSASVGNDQVVDYTTISADTDAMLFDLDILHCQSQSNTGTQASRPQAWAKNIVSVGAVRHFGTVMTSDDCWGCSPSNKASRGPAADGRIKPDLSHFYDNVLTITTGSPTAYTNYFGGTSAATPIVAGYFGLFFQMWSEGILAYPVDPSADVFQNRPHMTTAKAVMINTAQPYPFSGQADDLTRVHQGWGLPSLQNLYDIRQKMFIVDETDLITNLGTISYEVTVDPGEPAARFTLVYADPPGVPASSQHRINDLTLQVTDPVGTIYWGNNGLLDGNWSVSGGGPNTVDTIENVFVQNPLAGTWTVDVIAAEINQDGHVETPALDADYALVVSGVQQQLPPLVIRLPQGVPDMLDPLEETTIPVKIFDGDETALPGSAALLYRFDPGGSFTGASMTWLGGDNYQATLPVAPCGTMPELYFSAQGDGGTVVTLPASAPSGFFTTAVGEIVTVHIDNFETDQGWTVVNDGNLTDGAWERGVPAGGGDRGDPPTDFDGSGQCFLTDNADGNSDVDNGTTWLISPAYDLTGLEARVEYALWYSNDTGGDPLNDVFRVYVSDDDGEDWTLAQTVGPASGIGWTAQGFEVNDVVEPTDEIRFRFEASDPGVDSVVEAAIDDFRISKLACVGPCPADLDSDGMVGVTDLLVLLGAWGTNPGGPPDFDGNGDVGVSDLLFLLGVWGPC